MPGLKAGHDGAGRVAFARLRACLRREPPRGADTHALPRHLADVEAARAAIAGHVIRTPLVESPRLSALTGARVFVKYENMQATASFKERGAANGCPC